MGRGVGDGAKERKTLNYAIFLLSRESSSYSWAHQKKEARPRNVGRQHLLPLGNFRGSPFILSPFILKIMFPHSGDDGLVISPLVVELAEAGDRVIATLSRSGWCCWW